MDMTPFAQSVISMGQQRGYSPTAISAILGNGQQESGNDPETDPGDNGTAFGAMQWRGPRWAALQSLAKSQGKDPTDPDVQATHLFNELDGPESKSGAALKSATDLKSANDAMQSYLRYGDDSYNTRLQNANQWAQNLGGGAKASQSTGALSPPQATPSAVGGLYDALTGGPGALSAVGPDGLNASSRFGDGLTGLGAALMARDNPTGAAVLNSSLNSDANRRVQLAQLAMQKQKYANSKNDVTVLAKGDKGVMVQDGTGAIKTLPNTTDTPDDGKDKFTAGIYKATQQSSKDALIAGELVDNMNELEKTIVRNNLKMNMLAQGRAEIVNSAGVADKDSEAIKDAQRIANRVQTLVANTEAGPKTKYLLQSAFNNYFPAGSTYDPATYMDSMKAAQKTIKDTFATNTEGVRAAAETTRGISSDIVDSNGKRWKAEDLQKDAFDRWNKHEADFGPEREAWKQAHISGNGQPAGFKSYFKSQTK